jgi:hypothetical protein
LTKNEKTHGKAIIFIVHHIIRFGTFRQLFSSDTDEQQRQLDYEPKRCVFVHYDRRAFDFDIFCAHDRIHRHQTHKKIDGGDENHREGQSRFRHKRLRRRRIERIDGEF